MDELIESGITEEEVGVLNNSGWFYNEDNDCIAAFV